MVDSELTSARYELIRHWLEGDHDDSGRCRSACSGSVWDRRVAYSRQSPHLHVTGIAEEFLGGSSAYFLVT